MAAAGGARGARGRGRRGRGRGGRDAGGRFGGASWGRNGGEDSGLGLGLGGVGAAAGKRKAVFNPYEIPDEGLLKGGKRSSVAPRSGNRSMTFQ
jgi:hypothetical protein